MQPTMKKPTVEAATGEQAAASSPLGSFLLACVLVLGAFVASLMFDAGR